MAPTATPPQNPCPKCGEPQWRGPTYAPPAVEASRRRSGDTKIEPEKLEWSCMTCGFTVAKRTNDAVPEA